MLSQEVLDQFNKRAANASPLGGTLKFMLDGNAIYIDGTGSENTISQEDKEADCTVSTSLEVLEKLRTGNLNPMMAVMSGKIKIKGDMGLAMKLQSLLG
ncbi:MAG: SCP2 sterol-binding domain-containing protein [Bacteroidota bacterium]